MRKLKLIVAAFSLLPIYLFAQTEQDLLRWSETELIGTARYVSMGGAFHALGGDFSAIPDNPAATAVFLKSEFSASLGLSSYGDKINFLNRSYNNASASGGFPVLGFVSARSLESGNFKNINFSVSHHRLKNLNRTYSFAGDNSNYPLAAYLADVSFGTEPNDLPTAAYLAYQGYVINPIYGDSTQPVIYSYGINPDSLSQNFSFTYKGRLNETNFTLGTNYNNKVYLGFGVGFVSGTFDELQVLGESANTTDTYVRDYTIATSFTANTFGVNAKFGVIVRAGSAMRFSLSYQTPTALSSIETYSGSISSDTTGGVSFSAFDPDGGEYNYEYTIVLPAKISFGAAAILGKQGAISASLESQGYGTAKFKSSSNSADQQIASSNIDLQNVLKTQSFKASIGGEFRTENMSYRAGVSLRTNPIKREVVTGLTNTIYYTAGLGYRNDGFYVDGALVYGTNSTPFYPYGASEKATIKTSFIAPTFTLGLRF